MSTTQKRVLLVVLAHPDDETFGMGGTLAHYARQGVEVHLVCATRGEVGEVEPERLQGFDSIGDLREHELCCAAEVLGLRKVHFLDYRDSGMPGTADNQNPQALVQAPVEKVAARVAAYMRELRPQVVLTFDPVGGYMHPDHIAIQQATVLGFDLSYDPEFADPEGLLPFQPEKLFFHTMNRTFLKISVRVMRLIGQNPRQFGRNKDIDLVSLTEVDFPTHVKINYREVRDVKTQAAACHASQGGAMMNKGVRGTVSRLFSGYYDTFMQAYPEVKGHWAAQDDLYL